jgi:purine-binding chemotaxis protein CheW
MTSESNQYLTFKLGDELFAIQVANVREILEIPHITRVPTAPDYMRGVVNVRGKAIPVADLRLKFGLPPTSESVNTRIVVMDVCIDGEATVIGGIADSVHEVIELENDQISPPPRIALRWRSELIRGMGRRGNDFIIVLDIQSVFALDDLTAAGAAADEGLALTH